MTTQNLEALENIDEVRETAKKIAEKIEMLKKEKTDLLAEMVNLRKKGEAKALALENEVSMLGKEVRALEKLLNVKEKTQTKKS